jgi:tRNA threonylcarbamoyladenosine biosynthesis protein TsaE
MISIQYNIDQIGEAAKVVIINCSSQKIWLFDGSMGAGKTTLIREVCKQLGVQDAVQSPTFSIVNEYMTADGCVIYHFDCYRLKNETEALDIGIEDYLYANNRCFIEWPEKIASLLPTNRMTIKIEILSEVERKIVIEQNK